MRRARSWGVVCSIVFGAVIADTRPTNGQSPAGANADADRVMNEARAAIGGESRLAAMRTFIATGRTQQIRGDNLVPIEFEIQAELPDKYVRRDEFPAQDAGPQTIGFNGDRAIQIPPPAPARGGGSPQPTPQQLEAGARARALAAKQDFARLMLGLFAASIPSYPLTFSFVGQAEAPQGRADVIDVKGPDAFAARLFIDSKTHLPLMLSWQARSAPAPGRGRGPAGPPPAVPPAGAAPAGAGSPAAAPGAPAAAPPQSLPSVENRLYFAEYRSFDGLQLPTRVRRAAAGETTEEITFDRFRINARVDSKRFDPGN
jgi:hypothetical protein